MNKKELSQNRIYFFDELRGLAVFCMIFYHAFFILDSMFGYEWAAFLFEFFMPAQPFFAGLFIFICGMSCSLSRSNAKRGIRLLACAGVVTLFTALIMPVLGFDGMEIYFGILHLLASCILIYAAFEKPLKNASALAGIFLCAVLYPFFSGIRSGFLNYGELFALEIPEKLYESDWLAPLGIYSPDFFSADYFPIFPNIFIFFAGAFAGRYFVQNSFPEWMHKSRAPFLGSLGRKALIIYIVHMPAVYILAYVFELIINLFN